MDLIFQSVGREVAGQQHSLHPRHTVPLWSCLITLLFDRAHLSLEMAVSQALCTTRIFCQHLPHLAVNTKFLGGILPRQSTLGNGFANRAVIAHWKDLPVKRNADLGSTDTSTLTPKSRSLESRRPV